MSTTVLTPGKVAGLKTRKAGDDRSLPSLVVYGGSGTGKTTLAASSCEVESMNPVLILNVENGTQSIKEIYPDIDVVDINAFQELQDAYDTLYDQTDFEAQTCAGFKTVILDNLTETQKKGMEHIFRGANIRKTGGISFSEFTTASWENHGWNDSSEQMRKLIRAFRGLPCYIIFCAWELDLSKKESAHLWTPAFSRTLAGEAPGLVNDVYRLHFDREGDRALTTGRTATTVAKDRSRKLPQILKNPTMPLIHAYWTGALVKPPDEAPTTKSNLVMRTK